jgi:hypothetical protein
MESILYPEQSKLIYNVSFLSLGSSIYAVYNGYYDLAVCPGGVFLTSINYWKQPDYSWRRYLDITYVKLAICYQLYKAYGSQYMVHYYSIMAVSVSMYLLGVHYYKQKRLWHSTYAHCMLHITANIGNLVLYSGKIA